MFSNSSLWALGVKRMRDVHPRQNILIICLLLPLRVWGFSNKSGPFTTEWSSQRSNRSLFVKRSVPNDDSSIKDFKVIYIIVKSFQSFEDTIAKCKSVTFCLNMKQARKLQATLVQNYHRPSHLLTGVKCRATSVAKNYRVEKQVLVDFCLFVFFFLFSLCLFVFKSFCLFVAELSSNWMILNDMRAGPGWICTSSTILHFNSNCWQMPMIWNPKISQNAKNTQYHWRPD